METIARRIFLSLYILVSISLITVSILLGYIVETSYNRLSTYLNGWKSLAGSIIIAYLLIYGSLRYLKTNAEEFHVSFI
jgi:hypothetical protein